jgi:DNA-binding transcriptional LysR family regulator
MTISISYMAGYRMDLNASHMFVAVVQAGSLSAAATRLGIPLPTLSRRIRDLERQLKVQLLERSARGTKLTDAGTRLYEHASRGIEALLDAEQAVLSDQARLKGRLRFRCPRRSSRGGICWPLFSAATPTYRFTSTQPSAAWT